jgi:molecular chaperone Hsp33
MSIDTLHRFTFAQAPVRGLLVQLETAWQDVQSRHHYPAVVRKPLGQLLAAAALLGSNLKAAGQVIIELRGAGPLRLLVADNRAGTTVRALARWEEPLYGSDWHDLLGDGRLVITLDARGDGRRYQGIVPLDSDGLAPTLERYFASSEQLPAWIMLAGDDTRVAGLLLQRLPGGDPQEAQNQWDHVQALAETTQAQELLRLEPARLLTLLFGDQDLHLLAAQAIHFGCSCSEQRVEAMLVALGRDELESLLAERGAIDVDCEFCNQHYHFDRVAVLRLLTELGSGARH